MSFFNKIVKGITSRFKKAQTIDYDTIESVDNAIDQIPEERFSGEMSPEFLTNLVENVRTYLSKINPSDPLGSPLSPLPEIFHSPKIADHFAQIATQVLVVEKGIDRDTADTIINYLLGEGDLNLSGNVAIEQQITEYVRSIPTDLTQIPTVDQNWLRSENIGTFQSVARNILSSEYKLTDGQVDEVISEMMSGEASTIQPVEVPTEVPTEVPAEAPIVDMTDRIPNLPASIQKRISNNILGTNNLFTGLSNLDETLGGSEFYSIGERPRGSQHDLYPVKWASPSAKLFRDIFIDEKQPDGSIDTEKPEEILNHLVKEKNRDGTGGAGMVKTIKNLIGQYGIKVPDDDIVGHIWESLNPENIPLGRSMGFSPSRGILTCYKDYLVGFFISYPQYLEGTGIEMTTETDESGRGNEVTRYLFNGINLCKAGEDEQKIWAIRNKMSEIMNNVMSNESGHEDVTNYVYKTIPQRIANIYTEPRRRGETHISVDALSPTGSSYGKNLSKDLGVLDRDKTKDRDVIKMEANEQRWNTLNQFASTENGGGGNIFRELYDQIGKPTLNGMTNYLSVIQDGTTPIRSKDKNKGVSFVTLRNNLLADTLQSFMLMGVNGVDDLFVKDLNPDMFNIAPLVIKDKNTKEELERHNRGTVKGSNGKVFLNMDTGEVSSWRDFVSVKALHQTIVDISKAKNIISHTDMSRTGSNPRIIADETARQLRATGVENPVVYSMLQDDDFIKRSKLIDPSLADEMNKLYNIPQKKFNTVIDVAHSEFVGDAYRAVVEAESNIRNTYRDDPDTMNNQLWRLDEMKKIFGQAYPSHSYYNKEEEGYAVGGKVQKELTNMFGEPITPRKVWWMITGRDDMKPIPSQKESSQIVNGLYKIGNSVLVELVRSQKMLDKFGLGTDIRMTINKVGDEYRNKIESLRY